jgi:hypothetical protein
MAVVTLIAAEAQSLTRGLVLGLAFGLGKSASPVIALGVVVSVLPERLITGLRGRALFARIGGALLFLAGLNLIVARMFLT